MYVTRDGWFGGGVNALFQNDGRGIFADATEVSGTGDPGSSFCAAWSDFDRDGYLDIYVANGTGATGDSTNVLYRNQGDGTFVDVAEAAGVAHKGQALSTAWGDFDGDSWPDLYACNFTEPNVLFRNRGDGAFADQTEAAGVGAEYIDGFITFVSTTTTTVRWTSSWATGVSTRWCWLIESRENRRASGTDQCFFATRATVPLPM